MGLAGPSTAQSSASFLSRSLAHAARAASPDLTEHAVRDALEQLDPLWDELFPVEQARIIHLLVDRVEIGASGATVRLRLEGLTSLVRDLGARDRQEAA